MSTSLIVFLVLVLLGLVGLSKIFDKAGVASWKAFVPILNLSEWLKLIGKPQWWIALMFIPIVNIFYLSYMLIGLAKAFKHYSWGHHFASVAGFFAYLPYLGFSKNETYFGPDGLREGERHPEKSTVRGWVDAVVFAIFAAYFIRMFLIEAYKIPTSSMEPTLQIGDFMFVSKVHYGSRMPNTPLALPLIHHSLPRTKKRAYSELIKWDYFRFPRLQEVKRNDIVVFNAPFEHNMQSNISQGFNPGVTYKSRPVDKREHYIKRVIGMPGDSLQIIDNQVYIDSKPATNPELIQFKYKARREKFIDRDTYRENGVRAYTNYFFAPPNRPQNPEEDGNDVYVNATPKAIGQLEQKGLLQDVAIYGNDNRLRFPRDKKWTAANFGTIWIPKKGETIVLTDENYETYKEAIGAHEHNTIRKNDKGEIVINGEKTNEYTFKLDYYFMMGDNRHGSSDSRDWGFVPEDHIVGKPLFIFWSGQKGEGNIGFRWNRFFKGAQDMN